jgi:hypothetical protein
MQIHTKGSLNLPSYLLTYYETCATERIFKKKSKKQFFTDSETIAAIIIIYIGRIIAVCQHPIVP